MWRTLLMGRMKWHNEYWVGFIIAWIVFMAIVCSGCSILGDKPPVDPKTVYLDKVIHKTNWMATIAILGIAAGFFAFLNGNNAGLKIMASCFVMLSIVLMVARFAMLIAVATGVGAVGLLGYTIWLKRKALLEVVESVEHGKANGGWDSEFVKNAIQSPTTTNIVKSLKKVLKKKNGKKTKPSRKRRSKKAVPNKRKRSKA
jgi:type IV secretory pathway VirB6-like protein